MHAECSIHLNDAKFLYHSPSASLKLLVHHVISKPRDPQRSASQHKTPGLAANKISPAPQGQQNKQACLFLEAIVHKRIVNLNLEAKRAYVDQRRLQASKKQVGGTDDRAHCQRGNWEVHRTKLSLHKCTAKHNKNYLLLIWLLWMPGI